MMPPGAALITIPAGDDNDNDNDNDRIRCFTEF